MHLYSRHTPQSSTKLDGASSFSGRGVGIYQEKRKEMQLFLPLRRVIQLVFLLSLCAAANLAVGATTKSNIDQMTGWESCSVCAGHNGAGPTMSHSVKLNVASPSMDGRSAQFSIGGGVRYGNALWWKQLGHNDGASNFVYDLYYYIKNPAASQALEFDVNQSRTGHKYIFGTECDFRDKKVWKVYDPYNRTWKTTGIGCSVPKAYTWHHVVLEFKRSTSPAVNFVSVTINGKKHYFNRKYAPRPSGAREVNVAFQMDANGSGTAYTVWLDKVKLTYW